MVNDGEEGGEDGEQGEDDHEDDHQSRVSKLREIYMASPDQQLKEKVLIFKWHLHTTMTLFVAQACCFWNLSELDRFLS